MEEELVLEQLVKSIFDFYMSTFAFYTQVRNLIDLSFMKH
jgi:hypothetical protein